MANRKLGAVMIATGILLIVLAGLLVSYNWWDDSRARKLSGQAVQQVLSSAESFHNTQLYKQYPDMEMPIMSIEGINYIGAIEIPALDLCLPVIQEWSYPNLKLAPCRYSGSAYRNDLVIAAHNYKSHFGYIDQLEQNDSVYFIDVDQNRFEYKVARVEQISATNVEQMLCDQWDLTLFTCTISGKHRIAVRCSEVSQS